MADLRTLAIFVKVAERKSFVRAADDLGITQSGVSNAIKRLEEQTGTRLLARTTRRVSLTDDGAAFFDRCRQALAEIDEAEQVLKEAQLTPSTCRCRSAGSKWCRCSGHSRHDIPTSGSASPSPTATST
jgi:LysR family transcriptional regulator for bpeEF and oprC